jgi:hypothetical protein
MRYRSCQPEDVPVVEDAFHERHIGAPGRAGNRNRGGATGVIARLRTP